jgi:hypothetical protein
VLFILLNMFISIIMESAEEVSAAPHSPPHQAPTESLLPSG